MNSTDSIPQTGAHIRTRTKICVQRVVLFAALTGALALLPFHQRIFSFILEEGTLSNDSPDPGLVQEMLDTSPHARAAILAAWKTGKITHREQSIYSVRKIAIVSGCVPPDLMPLVEAAAFDPDLDVREDAFRILRKCHHPALASIVAAQLADCDPEVRLLGTEYLRWIGSDKAVPMAGRLLDDTDPRVVASALTALARCTHQNFGVKLTEIAAGVDDEKTGLKELHPGGEAKSKAGAELAKAWWTQHQSEYKSSPITFSNSLSDALPACADFEAATLDGGKVRLSDLRGKIVLLHFWATPRAGCLSELEDFNVLKKKYGDSLAIFGICLDEVPDDDGDIAGEDDSRDSPARDHPQHLSDAEIRERLDRMLKEKSLAYPIILDEHFSIGGRFNATTIPTTVVIDERGIVRRRFVGRRRLPVLEAMLDELRAPAIAQH